MYERRFRAAISQNTERMQAGDAVRMQKDARHIAIEEAMDSLHRQ